MQVAGLPLMFLDAHHWWALHLAHACQLCACLPTVCMLDNCAQVSHQPDHQYLWSLELPRCFHRHNKWDLTHTRTHTHRVRSRQSWKTVCFPVRREVRRAQEWMHWASIQTWCHPRPPSACYCECTVCVWYSCKLCHTIQCWVSGMPTCSLLLRVHSECICYSWSHWATLDTRDHFGARVFNTRDHFDTAWYLWSLTSSVIQFNARC